MADTTVFSFVGTNFGRGIGPRVGCSDPDNFWFWGKIDSAAEAAAAANAAWAKGTLSGSWSVGSITEARTTPQGSMNCWASEWTPNNIDNMLYCIFHEERTATEGPYYYGIDLSDDSTEGPRILEDDGIAAGNAATWDESCVFIAMSRGGVLYAGGVLDDTSSSRRTFRKANLVSGPAGAEWVDLNIGPLDDELTTADYFELYPGNETDDNDMWLVQIDRSANNCVLWTYDNSADTWSSGTTIRALANNTTSYVMCSGMIRHSDGHLILLLVNAHSDSTCDLECWDINGEGSITQKTEVWSNQDNRGLPVLVIDQQTDDLYAFWVQGNSTWPGTSCDVYRSKSTDGGATWGTPVQMNDTSTEIDGLHAVDQSIDDDGGHIGVYWFDTNANTIVTNYANWIEITAAAGGTTYEDSITLGVSAGYSLGNAVVFEDSVTMAVSAGVSQGNAAVMEDDATLAVSVGLSTSGGLLIEDSVSLGVSAGYSLANTLDAAEAVSLGVSVGAGVDADVVIEAAISLGVSAGMAFVDAGNIIEESVTFAVSAGYSLANAAVFEEAPAFGVSVGLSPSGAVVAEEAVTLGVSVGAELTIDSGFLPAWAYQLLHRGV